MTRILTAVAFAVLLGASVLYLGSGSTPSPDPAVVNPPDAPAVDTAAWRAAFPLDPPDVEPVLVNDRTPVAAALVAGLRAFRENRFADAARQFEEIWTDTPPSDHPGAYWAAFYLGVSRLHLDEVPNGIELLRQAQASPEPALAAMAQWYALVGIARLRDPSSALPEVREVCARPGPYQGRACEAAAALGR